MADRYDDFDRHRDRDRNWDRERWDRDRDRNWDRDRGRESGYRASEDYRHESRGNYGQSGSRDYEQQFDRGDYDWDRERGSGREGWRGIDSRFGGPEYNRGTREDWRASERSGNFSQGMSGGMGTYSNRDWRSNQGSWGGGMSEGFGRGRETWDRDRTGQDTQWTQGNQSNQGGTGSTWSGGHSGYSNQNVGSNRFVGRGPKGYQRSDDRIREDVCERLTQHPEIDASEIDIIVSAGEVTLSGSVDDRDQKRTAEDIAENIFGVREVHNQIRVSKGLGQRIGESLGLTGNRDREENRNRQDEAVKYTR